MSTFDRESINKQLRELDAREAEIMATLTVPADDDRGAYTSRVLTGSEVESIYVPEEGDYAHITATNGWTASTTKDVAALLEAGKFYALEQKGSQITGFLIDGTWYNRKTDEELAEEHRLLIEKIDRDRKEALEAHREEWQKIEDGLPDWLKARIATFHEKGGEKFRLDGWGYELMICELAAEYYKLGSVILDKDIFNVSDYESEAIKNMAREHGTSGNQHSMALALAKRHMQIPESSLAGTPSALTPITGDPFYDINA